MVLYFTDAGGIDNKSEQGAAGNSNVLFTYSEKEIREWADAVFDN